MTTEWVSIRHGETDWNTERRYQGTSDTNLNPLGMRQAQGLAEAMRGEPWDLLASSPLQRAWQTAMPLAAALGISGDRLMPDERLMERRYGAAEGYTLAEREQLYPGDVWDGLESREELNMRSMTTLEDFRVRFARQRIVLVTHGTWITSVLEVLTQGEFGYGNSVILNTSRTYLTHDGEDWQVGAIAQAPHLALV